MLTLCFRSHAATEAANAEAVMLEAVLVEASAGTSWQIATLPGYVILSRCPETFNQQYARGLERAARARQAFLPAAYWAKFPTPMNIILFDQAPKKAESTQMPSPIDLSWSSESDAILGGKSIRRSHPVTVGDGDLYVSCGNYWNVREEAGDISIDPDSDLKLRNRIPQFPRWFLSGMVGTYGVYSSRVLIPSEPNDELMIPNAVWISPAETVGLRSATKEARRRKRALAPPALLPLATLFTSTPAEGQEALWESEAGLFVRWGLLQKEPDGHDYREAFLRFVDATSGQPASEDMFKTCFGFGYAEAEKKLGDYLPTAISETLRLPFARVSGAPVSFREATATEVARIVGGWARLQAKALGPSYTGFRQECLDRADRLFHRESVKPNRDASFLVEYSLYLAQVGDDHNARVTFEAVHVTAPLRPRALVELARLRLNADLPSAPEGFGDLKPAEFEEISKLLSEARAQMPELLASYNVLAQALEHAPERPTRGQLQVLREAAAQFSSDSPFIYKVATLYRRCGYTEDAIAIAALGLPFATTDRGRALLLSVAAPHS